MTLLDSLHFVKGAVAKKDFNPALNHYCIDGGRVRSFNGGIALSSPIALDISARPKADMFGKAIEAIHERCQGESEVPQLSLAEDGSLSIRSGSFSVFVECLKDDSFPKVYPEGRDVSLSPGLMSTIQILAPFMAEDASRPWARGILFRGASAYATNNVCLVEKWLGYNFPAEIVLSTAAVNELLRIGEDPYRLQVSEASVTFHFEGERWLRAQNHPTSWPDVSPILDRESNPRAFPDAFFSAVDDLEPFVNPLGQIFFRDNLLTTDASPSRGASVAVEGVSSGGCFHVDQLSLLRRVATVADFSLYPAPCLFFGDNLRGAIVGINT